MIRVIVVSTSKLKVVIEVNLKSEYLIAVSKLLECIYSSKLLECIYSYNYYLLWS